MCIKERQVLLLLFSIRLLNWLDWEDLMSEMMERKGFFSLDYKPPTTTKVSGIE